MFSALDRLKFENHQLSEKLEFLSSELKEKTADPDALLKKAAVDL